MDCVDSSAVLLTRFLGVDCVDGSAVVLTRVSYVWTV